MAAMTAVAAMTALATGTAATARSRKLYGMQAVSAVAAMAAATARSTGAARLTVTGLRADSQTARRKIAQRSDTQIGQHGETAVLTVTAGTSGRTIGAIGTV